MKPYRLLAILSLLWLGMGYALSSPELPQCRGNPPQVTPCLTDLPPGVWDKVREEAARDAAYRKSPDYLRWQMTRPGVRRYEIDITSGELPAFTTRESMLARCTPVWRQENVLRGEAAQRLYWKGALPADIALVQSSDSLDEMLGVVQKYHLELLANELEASRDFWASQRPPCTFHA